MTQTRLVPTRLIISLLSLTGAVWSFGCGSGGDGTPKASSETAATEHVAGDIDPEYAQAGLTAEDLGPGEPTADRFNPDKREAKPALGGRVIQHIASEPPNLNFAIENSAVIRWIHFDIHAGLLSFNPATWKYDPELAEQYWIEDTVVKKGGRGDDNANILYGTVTEDGTDYVVTSGCPYNKSTETRIPMSEVESVQKGTVFTFKIRDGVYWHDGEKYDAEDALFSWEIYGNPNVDCDEKRYAFEEIVDAEIVDPLVVRYYYGKQYFLALQTFDLSFCQLPSHLYNLLDPTNKDYDPKASLEKQGTYINENPHNIDWVGLGPYQLVKWERGQYLEAKKFDKFWNPDPAYSGYMDVLRWRHIDDDNLAFQALLNGEVDIFDRVKSEDFMGAATKDPAFTDKFYKAFTYTGSVGFTVWNTLQPQLSDPKVRTALAYAFDVKDWIRTNYEGLALPATYSAFRLGPAYNRDVKVLPYDIEKAQSLLTEAGWYDRDNNGIVDKDGEDLVIEVLMPSGNKASEKLLQKMQESYEKIGVKLTIQPYEWATFIEHLLDSDYDAANLAWVLSDIESDPYGSWHQAEADPNRRTSNYANFRDQQASDLIDQIRVELDPQKRYALEKQLHARIYELQPFLFGWNVPRKIAFNKDLRGVKLYKFDPGYRLRDMYYEEGTPGTRPMPGA
ncbi:MAG: ABC transporter substrate-binding protein [Candidatus Eisenbacteria bacterium]